VLAAAVPDLATRVATDSVGGEWWSDCLASAPFAVPLVVHGLVAGPLAEEAIPTGIWRFQVLRSLQLTSGLSPLLPILLLLCAWLWWTYQMVSGCTLTGVRSPYLPKGVTAMPVVFAADSSPNRPKDTYIVGELVKAVSPGRNSISLYLWRYVGPGALLAAGFWCLAAFSKPALWPLTLDGPRFGLPIVVLFWLTVAGIVGTTLCLWDLWAKTRRLLTVLDAFPLRDGFKRLEGFTWQPLWRVGLSSLSEFQRMMARLREAMAAAKRACADLSPKISQAEEAFVGVLNEYDELLKIKGPYLRGWYERRRREQAVSCKNQAVQVKIAEAAGHALDLLAAAWERGREKSSWPALGAMAEQKCDRALERFVCLMYVSFLLVVLVRLRTLIMAIAGMYILLLVAMTAYPFQPRATIVGLLALLLAVILGVVALVFAQLHRNNTLSHLTDTTPGELGSDFWIRLTSFAALPLATFFASQFPQLNRMLYSWFEPALQALNK
jgi:hypothetical protein